MATGSSNLKFEFQMEQPLILTKMARNYKYWTAQETEVLVDEILKRQVNLFTD